MEKSNSSLLGKNDSVTSPNKKQRQLAHCTRTFQFMVIEGADKLIDGAKVTIADANKANSGQNKATLQHGHESS